MATEMKPEDVMRALEHVYFPNEVALIFRDDAEGEEFEVTFADIIALLREKDADINGLEADNEHLTLVIEGKMKQISRMAQKIVDKDAEIERLNKERDDARRDCAVAEQNHYECKKELETARAEAITEFAEKLKEAVKYIPWCEYPPVHNCIDQIAKEMKGN